MCHYVNICLSALLRHESAILNPVLINSCTHNFKVKKLVKNVKCNIDSKNEGTVDKNTHFMSNR